MLSTGKKGKYSSLMLSLFYKKMEEEMFIVAWLCSSSDMKKEERNPTRVLAFLTGPCQFVVLVCDKQPFCEM